MNLIKFLTFTWLVFFLPRLSIANPYPDPNLVPKDSDYRQFIHPTHSFVPVKRSSTQGSSVLRVELKWDPASETFILQSLTREPSGTASLIVRSGKPDALGSYKGALLDRVSNRVLAYDSVGTGSEYRKLVRALTFRFPFPDRATLFELTAENPKSGAMERSLKFNIDPDKVALAEVLPNLETKVLRAVNGPAQLILTIYAEGYTEARREIFWQDAQHAVNALVTEKFPGADAMEFHGVFAVSNSKLGNPRDLEMPVPVYDSFLGLFYPYWEKFGRWYNIVYPTREEKFRTALGQVAYDYPLILIDDGNYWGIGNYRAFTAIPARAPSFTYLLLHEFGHFFGLNEEYEGGGRTELEFAPDTVEPWSQNMSFLPSDQREDLKWNRFVLASTPLPTPPKVWDYNTPLFGAYKGGYGDSDVQHSHKPGYSCVMERAPHFCPICQKAINDVVVHDTDPSQP